MLVIETGNKGSFLTKLMDLVDFFKGCSRVKTFGNLVKSLSIDSLSVNDLQFVCSLLHLLVEKFLPTMQFLCIYKNLLLLLLHFSFYFANLTL